MLKTRQKTIRSRAKRLHHMDKEILDVEGAAALLGVSKSTVYKMAATNELPGIKVGKEWRFARRNLINWVAQSTNGEPDLATLLKNANVRVRK